MFGGERPQQLFRAAYMSAHGGFAGEIMWGGLNPVVGRIGVEVLCVALLVAGLLLVTGSSLRHWAAGSGRHMASAGRVARGQAEALGVRRREAAIAPLAGADQSVTGDASDLAYTAMLPAVDDEPEPEGPPPQLMDGAEDAWDVFGEPSVTPDRATSATTESTGSPAAGDEVTEQMSLADEAVDAPGGKRRRWPSWASSDVSGRCLSPDSSNASARA